jgi:hypothetical protein
MIKILTSAFCHSGLSGILLQYRVAGVIQIPKAFGK